MSKFDMIVELMVKNGVTTKFSESLFKNLVNDEPIIELDFSEHDKVFEDKIAELENIINNKLGNWDKHGITYQEILDMKAENKDLEQRIAELERKNEQLKCDIDKMATSKSEWIDKAVEWQQKCEKLENKETEKPTKINLNDIIKVKLAPLGAEIYYHQYDEVNKKIKKNGGTELEPLMPQIDKDGFTEIQLWHFMELYGEHIGMCKPNVINPLDIIIVE